MQLLVCLRRKILMLEGQNNLWLADFLLLVSPRQNYPHAKDAAFHGCTPVPGQPDDQST